MSPLTPREATAALPEPPHPALGALRDVNCDELNPREALEKLYQLHKLAKS